MASFVSKGWAAGAVITVYTGSVRSDGTWPKDDPIGGAFTASDDGVATFTGLTAGRRYVATDDAEIKTFRVASTVKPVKHDDEGLFIDGPTGREAVAGGGGGAEGGTVQVYTGALPGSADGGSILVRADGSGLALTPGPFSGQVLRQEEPADSSTPGNTIVLSGPLGSAPTAIWVVPA